MKDYAQMTPTIRAKGLWQVRLPFVVLANVEYVCIAIRSFQDMYNDNLDVYSTVYEPSGITEGSTIDGSIFTVRNEELKGINIVSLGAPNGSVIHIPDNFILSYPNSTLIEYQHTVMICSLGPLPVTLDTKLAEQAMVDTVGNYFGIKADVKIGRVETSLSPTYEEHLRLEQVRVNATNINNTAENQIQALIEKLDLANKTVETLTQILVDNNIMPQ